MSARLPGAKYKRVFDRGRLFRGPLFSAYVLETDDAGRQAGVIVSKKSFHRAVDRNRAKRILREGFRLAASQLPPRTDWILLGRAALCGKNPADVIRELLRMVGKMKHA